MRKRGLFARVWSAIKGQTSDPWSTGGAAFAGAAQNRLLVDWIWSHLSADQEIRGELSILRGRSRELVRNDAWARRFVRLNVVNVIGAGIRLQARVIRADGLPNDRVNTAIEGGFQDWGRAVNASADRRLSWLGLQRLALKGLAMDGEFLARILRGFPNDYGFAVQPLDPDQLDHTFNQLPTNGRNEIRLGVEVDSWGAPAAYHLWRGHPTESAKRRERIRVPAEEIVHLYDPDRVNQTRGVPWLTPVMLDANMMRGYFEAELVAARVAAAKMGHYVNTMADGGPDEDEKDTAVLADNVEPGLTKKLPYGWTFQGWDPQHPTTAFPEFTSAVLHRMASGLGVSYASLTNDLGDTSYSSSRVGLLDERDHYRDTQGWVIEQLHQRVYAAWVAMARLAGKLDARVRPEDFLKVQWVPRGWAWIDPTKDIEAAILEIQNGLGSRRQKLAEQGQDLEEVLDDLVAEQALITEKGLTLGAPVSAPAKPTIGRPADEIDDPEDLSPNQRRNGNGNGNGNGATALFPYVGGHR
jgi:lambda family phage portal protein